MIRSATRALVFLVASFMTFEALSMTSYDSYDPLPLYSSANPHEFLYTVKKDKLLGIIPKLRSERASFTSSVFFQKATKAKNTKEESVMLGDMHGLWNMLALTYEHCPTTTALPPNLQVAAKTAFAETQGTTATTIDNPDGELFFGDESSLTFTHVSTTLGPHFGMVSAPLEYKKVGARFEASLMVFNNLGVRIQGGFSEIQQSLTSSDNQFGFIDRSADDLPTGELCEVDFCVVQENLSKVKRVLTNSDNVRAIAKELGIDVSDFRKSGFEDIRGSLFWRHAIPFNYELKDWPRFVLTPFVQVYGTLAVGAKRDPYKQFSVPFGNDGHDSVGFNTGVSLDFENTIEIAAEAGGTFFSSERKTIRLPVHLNQRGFLPCAAEATVLPGNNWHFIASMHAQRFIDRLSANAQFILISHNKDSICDVNNSCVDTDNCPKLLPEEVAKKSHWNWKMFTLALNYEIAPNITIGGIYEGPLSRKNAPRTKTFLGSLVMFF